MDKETKMILEKMQSEIDELKRQQSALLQDDFTSQQVVRREVTFNAAVYDASGTKVIN